MRKGLLLCLTLLACSSAVRADDAADCEKGVDRELVIRGCSGVITQDPRNAQGFIKRGAAYLQEDKYDMAIEDFSKAIEIAPNFDLAYAGRAGAFLSRANWKKEDGAEFEGDFNRAIADYAKAIEINPRFDDAYLGRASSLSD
jgi:tetratricopeptide (TPR) repeat protein